MVKKVTIVIPTYNEITRGSVDYWAGLIEKIDATFIFVDDGSKDGTSEYLRKYELNKKIIVIRHEKNKGKGEAIRSGIRHGLISQGDGLIAYLDADGAFTCAEVNRIIELSEYQTTVGRYDSIWTSRVKLSGRKIDRVKFWSFRRYFSP